MNEFDVVVLGAGPGGYAAALRCAQLGLKTALVEKEALGGTCLHHGCIPSKALLESTHVLEVIQNAASYGIRVPSYEVDFEKMMQSKREIVNRLNSGIEGLLKKRKVEVFYGAGRFLNAHSLSVEGKEGKKELSGKFIILATGARTRAMSQIPVDGKKIITSREALAAQSYPKRILIVGGGASGCEFATFYQRLGVSVILVEMMAQLLPSEDSEMARRLEAIFKRKKIQVFTQKKVARVEQGTSLKVTLESGEVIETDQVLVCAGYERNLADIGLDKAGIQVEKNAVTTNAYLQTSQNHIYAIGDVLSSFQLAHVATYEGLIAAHNIYHKNTLSVDYTAVPKCVYSEPEVASVGLTLKEAEDQNIKASSVKVLFSLLGKAQAIQKSEGYAKLIFNSDTKQLLGAQMIGPGVTELIAELTLAVRLKLSVVELAKTIHAHPTLSEIIMEAAQLACGQGLHTLEGDHAAS
jgi:dihydrolipoamide dehydrogenase